MRLDCHLWGVIMEALFKTNVKELIYSTKKRISEIDVLRNNKQINTFHLSKDCLNYKELRVLMDSHNEYELNSKLDQYKENLEYLEACDKEKIVHLNQTEWRHYFHGTTRPEWI